MPIGRRDRAGKMDDGSTAADQPLERFIILEAADDRLSRAETAVARTLPHQQAKRECPPRPRVLARCRPTKPVLPVSATGPFIGPGQSEVYWAASSRASAE